MRTTFLSLFVVFVVSSLAASHGNAPQPVSAPMPIVRETPRAVAVTGPAMTGVTVLATPPAADRSNAKAPEGPRLITPAAADLTDAKPASAPVAAPRP